MDPAPESDGPDRAQLAHAFAAARARTEALAAPLGPEDQVVQSMADASPTKWHLGHTTWFFESVVLAPHEPAHRPFDPAFAYLFNSYYEALGPRHPRPERGLLTRPPLETVAAYRRETTDRVLRLIEAADETAWAAVAPLVTLGIHHEQQHQELILTDILHVFSRNPLRPAYGRAAGVSGREAPPRRWREHPGGVRAVGADDGGFAFDNERPRHKVLLHPFRLASRPVTNGEFLAFIADGGYRRPELWLSDGWATAQAQGWRHPLYWYEGEGPRMMTLGGGMPLDMAAPVSHVSYYETDAYARWAGARLPTEAEWEVVAAEGPVAGNFADSRHLRPMPGDDAEEAPAQLYGDVWEWTASPYTPYPGFRPLRGAVGEYNGKFMVNQMVLRGGSCATPAGHVRPSYRNFFYPHQRWQFSGFRLAEDA